MAEPPTTSMDAFSDDALVTRLYELAALRTRGHSAFDREEMKRIDAVVYHRLAQAYSKDPHEPDPPSAYRLDS